MNTSSSPDRAITITEAAYICGCSEQSYRNWMRAAVDPAPGPINDRLARGRRWSELAVLEWAGRHAIRTARIVYPDG
jgi:predicted DNA-binding transcriptional regulator AlpA